MRALIAGGSGLIGRALTHELLRTGHGVTVLSRRATSIALPSGARALQWDGRTLSGWKDKLEDTDAVFNLAGESIPGAGLLPLRWTSKKKKRIRASRVDSGRVLAGAISMAERKPTVFIQVSAVGYYGPLGAQAVTESQPAGNDFLASVCQDWEASTADVEAHGVRRAVARIGMPLSIAGGVLPRLALPLRMFVGGRLGSGRQYFPWIHMADTAGALRFLIEHDDARGIFNISAPEPVTNAEFTRALAHELRHPYWLPVPGLAFRVLFGEMATMLLSGQRALPQHLQACGYTFQYPDLGAALEGLMSAQ
ncbi:MAG: TIGR01777 family oxidoreductase [Anaerolineales bacterium]|nr:TIGR01777 family oxidoreductase [Anaerolineales bacterium]HJO34034.1 TIGR01777 family oxidoreductase [Anaerolineales bacterium]